MASVSQVECSLKHILEERANVLARETHELRNEMGRFPFVRKAASYISGGPS